MTQDAPNAVQATATQRTAFTALWAVSSLRVTAQLIEAATGNHLWAERYDRDLEDIFALQDEVVREIVTAVPGKLDADAIQRAHRRPAENLTAYEFLLRAWQMRYRDWGSREARDLYEKVIAADPRCALAYAHLANWHAYSVMAHDAPRQEAERKMMTFADKALQLNANDPIILSILADGYVASGNLDLAKTCIDKAIRLNPNSYSVMSFASVVFAALGDIDAALHWVDLFRRHDPIPSTLIARSRLRPITWPGASRMRAIPCAGGRTRRSISLPRRQRRSRKRGISPTRP